MKLNYYSFLYLLLAVISGISYGFGGTIVKKGAIHLKLTSNVFDSLWRIVTAKYIIISLFFSALGYVLYVILVRKAEIITSVLIIQSVLFLSTIFFAHLFFRETITLSKIISLVLITAGIVVLLSGK